MGVLFSPGIFGAVFILIQLLQVAQGATALEAGVRTMPPLTGLITPRIGVRPAIVAGLACMTASLVWIALVLEGIVPEDQAVASGTNSTAREIGVALGIAALSAVFTTAGGELTRAASATAPFPRSRPVPSRWPLPRWQDCCCSDSSRCGSPR